MTFVIYIMFFTQCFIMACLYAIWFKPKFGLYSLLIMAALPSLGVAVWYVITGIQAYEVSAGRSLICLLITFIIGSTLFKGRLELKLIGITINLLAMAIVESICLKILPTIIIGSLITPNNNRIVDFVIAQLTFVVILLFLIVMIYFVKKFLNCKKNLFKISEYNYKRIFVILFPVSQLIIFLLILITIIKNAKLNNDFKYGELMIIISFVFILVDIMLFKVMVDNTDKQHLKEKTEIYERQLIDQLKHYEAFSKVEGQLRFMKHDLANQLHVVKALLEQKEYEHATNLSNEMENRLKDLSVLFFCKNKVINAILYNKYIEMKEKGIKFQGDFSIEEEVGIEKVHLCSVFTNILDNAIEACQVVEKDPSIYFSATIISGYLMIKSKNTFNSGYKVSKGAERGNGLKIIREIANQYNGEVIVNTQNGWFEITVGLEEACNSSQYWT